MTPTSPANPLPKQPRPGRWGSARLVPAPPTPLPPLLFTLLLLLLLLLIGASALIDQANVERQFTLAAAMAGAVVAAALLAAAWPADGARVPLGPLALLLLLFWGWSATALGWAVVPYLAHYELLAVTTALFAFAVWRSVAGSPNDPQQHALYPLGGFLIAAGLVMAGAMLYQYFSGVLPRGLFYNPNSAAGVVNMLWPAAAAAWLYYAAQADHDRTRRSYHHLLLLALFVMLVAATIFGSRAALIASVTAMLTLCAAAAYALRPPRSALLTVAGVMVAALLCVQTANHFDLGPGRDMADRVTGLAMSPASNQSVRLALWSSSLELIDEAPLLGSGPGSFWLTYPAIRSDADRSAGFFVHNDYLQIWVERGFWGFAVVLALLAATALLFWRTLRAARCGALPPGAATAAIAAFAGVLTVAVHALFSYPLHLAAFMIPVALLLAELERLAPQRPLLTLRLPSLRRPLPAIGAVALAALLMMPALLMALGERTTERGREAMAAGDYESADIAFNTARQRWPWFDAPWLYQADLYRLLLHGLTEDEAIDAGASGSASIGNSENNGSVVAINDGSLAMATGEADAARRELLTAAFTLLDGAEARNPLRPQLDLLRGRLLRDHSDLVDGDPQAAFARALALDPRDVPTRLAYAAYLARSIDDHAAAIALVEEGLKRHYVDRNDPIRLLAAKVSLYEEKGDVAAAATARAEMEARLEALLPQEAVPQRR